MYSNQDNLAFPDNFAKFIVDKRFLYYWCTIFILDLLYSLLEQKQFYSLMILIFLGMCYFIPRITYLISEEYTHSERQNRGIVFAGFYLAGFLVAEIILEAVSFGFTFLVLRPILIVMFPDPMVYKDLFQASVVVQTVVFGGVGFSLHLFWVFLVSLYVAKHSDVVRFVNFISILKYTVKNLWRTLLYLLFVGYVLFFSFFGLKAVTLAPFITGCLSAFATIFAMYKGLFYGLHVDSKYAN